MLLFDIFFKDNLLPRKYLSKWTYYALIKIFVNRLHAITTNLFSALFSYEEANFLFLVWLLTGSSRQCAAAALTIMDCESRILISISENFCIKIANLLVLRKKDANAHMVVVPACSKNKKQPSFFFPIGCIMSHDQLPCTVGPKTYSAAFCPTVQHKPWGRISK